MHADTGGDGKGSAATGLAAGSTLADRTDVVKANIESQLPVNRHEANIILLSVFGKALIFLQTEKSRVVLQHNYVEDHLSIFKRMVARGGPALHGYLATSAKGCCFAGGDLMPHVLYRPWCRDVS